MGAATPYAASVTEKISAKSEAWNPPPAQTRGREWLYDTFTPPEIFYQARARQFVVKPPSGVGDDEPIEAFGLELVEIRPEPFRLQLIGYMGDEGHWRGTFQNLLTGDVVLAGAGRRIAELGVTIKSLDVRPQPIAVADSMTTKQRVATAVVRDEKAGRDLILTHRERQLSGKVVAFVALAGEATTREVRVGDVLKSGRATYRIEAIKTGAIEVTKESPTLTQPERRSLTPRETERLEADDKPRTS